MKLLKWLQCVTYFCYQYWNWLKWLFWSNKLKLLTLERPYNVVKKLWQINLQHKTYKENDAVLSEFFLNRKIFLNRKKMPRSPTPMRSFRVQENQNQTDTVLRKWVQLQNYTDKYKLFLTYVFYIYMETSFAWQAKSSKLHHQQ